MEGITEAWEQVVEQVQLLVCDIIAACWWALLGRVSGYCCIGGSDNEIQG